MLSIFPEKINIRVITVAISVSFLLAACTQSNPTPDPAQATEIFKNALLTATYAINAPITEAPASKPSLPATITPAPATQAPAAPHTPQPLPEVFHTDLLNPLDVPHGYIEEKCQYLKMKWDPNNSAPGTVVMPVMFHSVTGDATATKEFQITHETLVQLLDNLKDQGFEAISIEQFENFLYNNAKIPKRSVILIVDDRHHEEYFRTHFEPQLKKFGWTMVNAWISHPSTTEDLWSENAKLQKEGWVDHQAHGVVHNVTVDNQWAPNFPITTDVYGTLTAEEYIRKELQGSIDAIQQHFGNTPTAYIWPGGGFSELSVKLARETGYKLGFTVNPRGPVMFNWVPMSDEKDPNRPSYAAEGSIRDPLMLLPRYWDVDASSKIDTVRTIGKDAAAYAQKGKAAELDYYDAVCKNITGEIPAINP